MNSNKVTVFIAQKKAPEGASKSKRGESETVFRSDLNLPERSAAIARLRTTCVNIVLGYTVGEVGLVHHPPLIVEQISHVIYDDEGPRTMLTVKRWQILRDTQICLCP